VVGSAWRPRADADARARSPRLTVTDAVARANGGSSAVADAAVEGAADGAVDAAKAKRGDKR